MLRMRDQLLKEDRTKAVQEVLVGFLLEEVVNEDEYYFDTEEPLPPPDGYVPPDE